MSVNARLSFGHAPAAVTTPIINLFSYDEPIRSLKGDALGFRPPTILKKRKIRVGMYKESNSIQPKSTPFTSSFDRYDLSSHASAQ